MNAFSCKHLAARAALLLALAAAALGIAACGGGVETGGTGGNATAYATGPITGFGSIIVGGVRFDDSQAEVDDGDTVRRTRDELKLGMTVDVEAGSIRSDGTATARRVRFESELTGPATAVDVAGGAFNMLGQRVTVDAATVFDERITGGLAGLRDAPLTQFFEVYAVYDPALQRYRATRVEPAAALAGLRLRGPLAAVDTAARTLRIGSVEYSYAGALNVPATLAPGQYVRLRLVLQSLRWTVASFGVALQNWSDADGLRVEGLVTAFTSSASFSVNGRPVDASAAQFPAGTANLVLGARVEVQGTVRNGALRATQVAVKSDDDIRTREFELRGSVASVDAASRRFVLRGVTVDATRSALRYEGNGSGFADIAVGRALEVRGLLSADGRVVEATRIKFE